VITTKVDYGPKYNKPTRRLSKWCLISKLEVALFFLEKKKKLLRPSEAKYGSSNAESTTPFPVTSRELLHSKDKRNEAFEHGRHEETVK